MTTNHKERLDPALLRPGRADVHVRLDLASEKQIKELFLRFFPDQQELARQFTNQLPVNRLSMAKLQGHLLVNRESAVACVSSAKTLLSDDLSLVTKAMSIDEWLHRMNLLSQKKKFLVHKLRRVDDLKFIDGGEGQLTELELGEKLQCRRMWLMLSGDVEAKENFKYLSKHGIRSICSVFLESAKDVEEVVNSVPEDLITGY